MGLSDSITIELYCPYCGTKMPDKRFQTKDLGRDMRLYSLTAALIENERRGGGFLRLFFSCKSCNKYGSIDISDYDFELIKEVKEILEEEKNKLEIIQNEFERDMEKKNGN